MTIKSTLPNAFEKILHTEKKDKCNNGHRGKNKFLPEL
jgi:hypothetical protein